MFEGRAGYAKDVVLYYKHSNKLLNWFSFCSTLNTHVFFSIFKPDTLLNKLGLFFFCMWWWQLEVNRDISFFINSRVNRVLIERHKQVTSKYTQQYSMCTLSMGGKLSFYFRPKVASAQHPADCVGESDATTTFLTCAGLFLMLIIGP